MASWLVPIFAICQISRVLIACAGFFFPAAQASILLAGFSHSPRQRAALRGLYFWISFAWLMGSLLVHKGEKQQNYHFLSDYCVFLTATFHLFSKTACCDFNRFHSIQQQRGRLDIISIESVKIQGGHPERRFS